MKRILMMVIATIALCASDAIAKEIRSVVLTTDPVMHCSKCETKIKNHLKFEKGIKKIDTSVGNQTVTITYDADMTSEDAIMKSFSKINYNVKKVEQGSEQKSKCGGCPKDAGCAGDKSCVKEKKCCDKAIQHCSKDKQCCEKKKDCNKK